MNLSNYQEFSEEDLAQVKRWQAPNVGNKTKSESLETDELPSVLTVQDIEAMQKQAYDEAFAQGHKEGFSQGYVLGHETKELELQQQAIQFTQLMETFTEPFKTLDEEVEKELITLAITIANQIIRREIKMDPGQVVAAVREALNVLPLSSQKISLYLHPEDAELVRSALSLDEMQPAWNLVDDPLITRGGCKLDTEFSRVDATVENRLAAVVATLFGGERGQDKNR
ncbi:MAG: flagellar assembly protein FliH [Methylococcaceae bacterium]|jgi:flagellar assembly protein FliH